MLIIFDTVIAWNNYVRCRQNHVHIGKTILEYNSNDVG